MFFLATIIYALTIRFQNKEGYDIPDITKYHEFIIFIENGNENVKLNLQNHNYHTYLNFNVDPCKFKVSKIKKWQENYTEIIKEDRNSLGTFDSCEMKIDYNDAEKKYVIYKEKSGYKILVYDKKINEEFVKQDSSDKSTNTLKIVIVNDFELVKQFGEEINNRTHEIFKSVKKIFEKSNSIVDVSLTEIINMKESIFNRSKNENSLQVENLNKIRKIFEKIRSDPENFETSLAESHMVVYLMDLYTHKPDNNGSEAITFFNGIQEEDKSYSLVLVDENSNYTAMKIAHELAHAMGVPHDNNYSSENIMIPLIEYGEENQEKIFTNNSLKYITEFYNTNTFLFNKKNNEFNPESLIFSERQAKIFIKSLRKGNSYNQIVQKVLKGYEPDTMHTKYFSILSLIFYFISMFVAIFFIK